MVLHIHGPAFVKGYQTSDPHASALLFQGCCDPESLGSDLLPSGSFLLHVPYYSLVILSVTMTFKMLLSQNIEFFIVLSIFHCMSNSLYLINKSNLALDYFKKKETEKDLG